MFLPSWRPWRGPCCVSFGFHCMPFPLDEAVGLAPVQANVVQQRCRRTSSRSWSRGWFGGQDNILERVRRPREFTVQCRGLLGQHSAHLREYVQYIASHSAFVTCQAHFEHTLSFFFSLFSSWLVWMDIATRSPAPVPCELWKRSGDMRSWVRAGVRDLSVLSCLPPAPLG